MAAFAGEELDWRRPDTVAIVHHGGLLPVRPGDLGALSHWLRAERCTVHTVDFGLGFDETQRQLGVLFRWEDQFGYRLESGTANLDALADGFAFSAAPGSRIALVVLRSDALLDRKPWLLGFLAIAAGQSVYQLALGNRFVTVLPLVDESPLVGATFETRGIPIACPLRLPREDGGRKT